MTDLTLADAHEILVDCHELPSVAVGEFLEAAPELRKWIGKRKLRSWARWMAWRGLRYALQAEGWIGSGAYPPIGEFAAMLDREHKAKRAKRKRRVWTLFRVQPADL